MSVFSETLKKLMKEHRISAKELSHSTGIPASTLSEWQSGRTPKFGDEVLKIAKFFGISLESLVTEQPNDAIADALSKIDSGFLTVHQGVYRVTIEKQSSVHEKTDSSDKKRGTK